MEIELEFDWTNDLLSSDWSVTLSAPTGNVSVRHIDDTIATMHMPVLGANPDPSTVDDSVVVENDVVESPEVVVDVPEVVVDVPEVNDSEV